MPIAALSNDHTCVTETSEHPHQRTAADSDLGTYVAVSGVTDGYYPLPSGSAAINAASSTYCLTRDTAQRQHQDAPKRRLRCRRDSL